MVQAKKASLTDIAWMLYHKAGKDDGIYTNEELRAELLRRVQDDPDLLSPETAVNAVLARIDKQVRAAAHKIQQGVLFPSEAAIPIGKGERVKLARAQPPHVLKFLEIQNFENAMSNAAFARTSAYYLESLRAWQPAHRDFEDVRRSLGDKPLDEPVADDQDDPDDFDTADF